MMNCMWDGMRFHLQPDGSRKCMAGHDFAEQGKPRTWSLPDEPGPEVKAVRDPVGELWVYGEGTWISDSGEHTWRYLVWREGPLTDATAELEEE